MAKIGHQQVGSCFRKKRKGTTVVITFHKAVLKTKRLIHIIINHSKNFQTLQCPIKLPSDAWLYITKTSKCTQKKLVPYGH